MRLTRIPLLLGATLLASQMALAVDMESSPESADADYTAARELIDAGRYEDAIRGLQKALRRDPESADVYNLLGFSHRKLGRWADAFSFYKRALAIEPRHLGANEYLGELHLERGEPELAEERLDVLLTTCGRCEEYKELAEAIEQYRAIN